MAAYARPAHQAFFLRRVQSSHPAYAGRNGRRRNVRSAPAPRSLVAVVHPRRFRKGVLHKRSRTADAFAWMGDFTLRLLFFRRKYLPERQSLRPIFLLLWRLDQYRPRRATKPDLHSMFSGFAEAFCGVGRKRPR